MNEVYCWLCKIIIMGKECVCLSSKLKPKINRKCSQKFIKVHINDDFIIINYCAVYKTLFEYECL